MCRASLVRADKLEKHYGCFFICIKIESTQYSKSVIIKQNNQYEILFSENLQDGVALELQK